MVSFNRFTLDTQQFQLRRQGEPVALEPLVFDLIAYLVENRERVVTREELLQTLWAGKVVTDTALSARIRDARRAVDDSGALQQVIRTIHGRGYQFIAEVDETPVTPSLRFGVDPVFGEILEAPPNRPSIAVLPLLNLGNDPQQEYFSDGITAEIITALSRIRNLLVIASDSTAHYKGKTIDRRKISREQGVRYVLDGSVRQSGKRVRVLVNLVDTETGQHVWAERYDRELVDIFAVQDDIVREIVVALDVRLNEGEQARSWSSGTENFEAWACVQQAAFNAVHDMRPDIKTEAQALLEKALRLDPGYAIAWVMLGWIYQQYADVASLASDSRGSDSAMASMLDCARQALDADPHCADAHCLMAMYHLEIKAFDEAVECAQKSVALAPGSANNLAEAAMVMNKTGNPRRALELLRKAVRACPNYRPGFLRGLGLSCYLLGQSDSAIAFLRESIAREPEYLSAYTTLAAIYGEQGDLRGAAEIVADIMQLAPEFSIDSYIACLSFRDPGVLERMRRGLQQAGLH